ncbi:hypothetical protein J21TS7_36450 [Paenibacillus cineris]|uniref:Uncharacterized protein n=1 Tax=Paenibacillus cineris TaxID=237530 RepID=A0ABQ4LFK7_9BACL|nr:hypothetical protein J21TS7_36450 [Paenibacillus cineris]
MGFCSLIGVYLTCLSQPRGWFKPSRGFLLFYKDLGIPEEYRFEQRGAKAVHGKVIYHGNSNMRSIRKALEAET